MGNNPINIDPDGGCVDDKNAPNGSKYTDAAGQIGQGQMDGEEVMGILLI